MKLSPQAIGKFVQVLFAHRVWIIAFLILLVGVQIVDACPGCKDALSENDPQHARMVRGYFWSILFMMAMPFTIAGTFGTFFYLEVRRKRLAQQAAATTVESLADDLNRQVEDTRF
tara:strand:- start:1175 stop:1522 length:348 start_codon:yes stop_codon:yes gene_type:complete